MTPTDISTLPAAIINKFISSMPAIVAEYTKETQRQKSSSSSKSSSLSGNTREEKLIYDRVRRERDLTKILQQQLKLRAHELKVIRNVNDMYMKIVKEQGTFNNSVRHASESLSKAVGDSTKTIYGFYQEMDKVASKSSNVFRRIASIETEAKKLQDEIKRNQGKGQAEIDARNKASLRLNELKKLIPDLMEEVKAAAKYTKSHISSTDPNYQSTMDNFSRTMNLFSKTKSQSLDDFIQTISNVTPELVSMQDNISNLNQSLDIRRKDTKQLDIILSEVARNMEQINHLAEIRGDIFAEKDRQIASDLNQQNEHLQMNLARWDKIHRKTPERMEEFLDEIAKTASGLREQTKNTLTTLTGNKPSIWQDFRTLLTDLKRTISTGKNKDGYDGSLNDAFGDFGKQLMSRIPAIAGLTAAFKTVKYVGGLTVGMVKEIAEDQRVVQKYGVNMSGMFSNFQDSMGTGLSNVQAAEWKFKNRNMNTALGGERAGVEQFRRFMNIPTDYIKGLTNMPEVEMLNYGGKQISFSELIGGDSDYQAETYSALTDSMAKLGILPTADAIKKALTESNGIMDVSYKTGMLPKELIEYYGEIADGLYATAQINKVGAEGFMNLTDEFLLMGRTLGANTEATKALNKSILANAKGDFVDQVTNQVYAQHYAKLLGADDNVAKMFGNLAGSIGQEKQQRMIEYLKDPAFRAIVEKQQNAMTNVYSPITGANAQNILATQFSKDMPGVQSLFESIYAFIVKDARKGTNDPAQANNKKEKEDLSHFAQSFEKSMKLMDQTTTKLLAGYNAIENITISAKKVTLNWNPFNATDKDYRNYAKTYSNSTWYTKDLNELNEVIENPSELGWFSRKNAPISKLISNRIISNAQEFIDSSAQSVTNAKELYINETDPTLKPHYNEQMLEYQKTVAEKISELIRIVDKQEKLTDVDKRATKEALVNMTTQKGFELPQSPLIPARGNSNKK